jgi:hypothetical protein
MKNRSSIMFFIASRLANDFWGGFVLDCFLRIGLECCIDILFLKFSSFQLLSCCKLGDLLAIKKNVSK